MLNNKLSTFGIVLAFSIISPLKATASSFSEFVFFGDSITDTGNVFLATGETLTPPFGATVLERPNDETKNFSNGLVWSQYIADFNGSDAVPSLAGGSNFAFGGATSQTLPDTISPSPSLEEQLDLWQLTTLNQADPDGLYFVQGGGNDIRLTGILPDIAEQGLFLQNSANSVGGVVQELIDAGANNITVLNAPDLGLTPEAISGGFSPQATALSQIYNNSLEQALDSLDTEGVNIIEVDLFGFIRSITDDPTAFGLPTDTVTDLSCISADSVCSNPDEFIFYDGIHPTTITHLALANVVNQQIHQNAAPISEPSTLLLTLGFVLVLVKRKNKSAKAN